MSIGETIRDASERHLLDVSVTFYTTRDREAVEVQVRIPGRPGTFRRLWKPPVRSWDSEQVTDMAQWVALAVTQALVGRDGTQGVLTLE